MMRYALTEPVLKTHCEVALDSDEKNQSGKLAYSGDPALAKEIQDILSMSCGAFGHFIGASTTPIDLHSAINSPEFQKYSPKLLEGEDIVTDYDPEIPPDALT